MKVLMQALERIFNIWQQDREDLIPLLQPGLSSREVQEQLSALPFHLPQEVHHLYQWHNGILIPPFPDLAVDFLPGFRFPPLGEAIRRFQHIEEFRQQYIFLTQTNPRFSNEYCHKPWFPILGGEWVHLVVLADVNTQESSPVLDISWKRDDMVQLKYPNLTSMMSVVAKCYDVGAYYIDTDIIGNQVIESLVEDTRKVARIERRANLERMGVSLKKRRRIEKHYQRHATDEQ
jgi:hypothetical protein